MQTNAFRIFLPGGSLAYYITSGGSCQALRQIFRKGRERKDLEGRAPLERGALPPSLPPPRTFPDTGSHFCGRASKGLGRSLRRGSPVPGRVVLRLFRKCRIIRRNAFDVFPAFLNIEKPDIPRKAAVRYWLFLFATPERCFPRCHPLVRCSRIHVYKQWAAAGKVLGGEAWRGRPLSRGAPFKVFPSLISRFRTLCSSVRQWQPSGPFCPPCRQSA